MKQVSKALSLLLAILLLAGAALPIEALSAPVEGVYVYVVNTSWLNIRSGPDKAPQSWRYLKWEEIQK